MEFMVLRESISSSDTTTWITQVTRTSALATLWIFIEHTEGKEEKQEAVSRRSVGWYGNDPLCEVYIEEV